MNDFIDDFKATEDWYHAVGRGLDEETINAVAFN